MQITVKSNAAAVAKTWQKLSRDYAKTIVSGLNKTAFRVAKEDMPAIMKEGIDRPVPFTASKRAGIYRRATVQRKVAYVGLQRIQEEYLQTAVFGGRSRKGKAVPVEIRINKYGNIASLKDGRKIKALLARPDHFAATFNGVSGIFKKIGKRVEMVIYFSQGSYRYRKTFDWHKGVLKYADKRLPVAMNEAINKTIAKYARI